MIKITKQQLKAVHAKIGCLDTDVNRVFAGVEGGLVLDEKLYHLEVKHEDAEDTTGLERFSLSELISDKPKAAAPVVRKTNVKEHVDGKHDDDKGR